MAGKGRTRRQWCAHSAAPLPFRGRALKLCRYTPLLMFRRAAHRLTTTLLVVLSLLFSQLALANYVCPQPAQTPAVGMQMKPGQPCEGMNMRASKAADQDQPVLCHQHCVSASQSFDPVQIPTPSLPAVVQVLMVPLTLDDAASEPVAIEDAAQARPPPDPLFLSTLRLRV